MGILLQLRLDLQWIYAAPAELDLLVSTPDMLKFAIFCPANNVTCPVSVLLAVGIFLTFLQLRP
jgi:hypothetical protein